MLASHSPGWEALSAKKLLNMAQLPISQRIKYVLGFILGGFHINSGTDPKSMIDRVLSEYSPLNELEYQ